VVKYKSADNYVGWPNNSKVVRQDNQPGWKSCFQASSTKSNSWNKPIFISQVQLHSFKIKNSYMWRQNQPGIKWISALYNC